MELIITRTYYPTGTNGKLYVGDDLLCYTIELPWRDNEPGLSCIPEGCYEVTLRDSKRFGRHLYLPHVPGRSFILIHPANSALKELRGCIAPVNQLTGYGTGFPSRPAFGRLVGIVEEAIGKGELVTLEIKRVN
ncbi:hypothetical protein SAMN05421788_11181 [Filimonas lacunae]|uniref:DUF5675 domain-containing protein n=1 Tax=Filimonas lacunae TaxID=477680 RepID=A0A173MB12_9BACT|nr:DUF5675 family protein [Filimonas lacunae]BAV04717.1 hypothetical protein FLA_0716 [Filimonas lacunae]SIT32303.1 hypothetical protein SAMN05421788_11181 [Filimonas lacunae]